MMDDKISQLKQRIANLEHGREYKNTLIHTLQKSLHTMERGTSALQQKVLALEYEKAEKDKTIATLTSHIQLKLEEHKTLMANQEILELKLLDAYGRLEADAEQYRHCGWGCPTCEEKTLTDLKNYFSCKKDNM
jgi:septal ring factor EnvC (AmiA/AmiB activator)